jgi:hypothetical protein
MRADRKEIVMTRPVPALRRFSAVLVALAFVGLPAHAWKDLDVTLDLSALNDPDKSVYGVDLLRKGSACVHPEDTAQKRYKDGDKIHVSFVETGDGCDKTEKKYLDMQLVLDPQLDGVPACNLRVGYDSKTGQYFVQGTASRSYTCESSTVNGATILRIAFSQ